MCDWNVLYARSACSESHSPVRDTLINWRFVKHTRSGAPRGLWWASHRTVGECAIAGADAFSESNTHNIYTRCVWIYRPRPTTCRDLDCYRITVDDVASDVCVCDGIESLPIYITCPKSRVYIQSEHIYRNGAIAFALFPFIANIATKTNNTTYMMG